MSLDLASNPFRNLRPLRRAGMALVVAGLVLAAVDARTYWRHFSGENLTRVELQELDAELDAERAELDRLRGELSRFDISGLNQRAVFVNQQISHRTFSWSGLFDRLVEVLPNDAHLVSLEPQFGHERGARRKEELREGEVALEIDGVARDGERLLALIDSFFQHPSFRRPDLQRESRKDGLIEFVLTVIYRPQPAPPADAPAASEPGSVAGEPGGGPVTPQAPEAGA